MIQKTNDLINYFNLYIPFVPVTDGIDRGRVRISNMIGR
jgi:hypothetical protein